MLKMKQEAATRRQRALSYAFSQQVLINDHTIASVFPFVVVFLILSLKLRLCFDLREVEEQKYLFCASCACACSDVHGPWQSKLGLELDGALDGGCEAMGEPDNNIVRHWSCRIEECQYSAASSGRLDPNTGHDHYYAKGQVLAPTELVIVVVAIVPVDAPATVVAVDLREAVQAREPEERPTPCYERPPAHQESAARSPATKQPGTLGKQPASRRAGEPQGRQRRQQPAPHVKWRDDHAIRASPAEQPGTLGEQPTPRRAGEP